MPTQLAREGLCLVLHRWRARFIQEASGERMSGWCEVRGINWYALSAFRGWTPALVEQPVDRHLGRIVTAPPDPLYTGGVCFSPVTSPPPGPATYCHRNGECLTLTHISGHDYKAALTDRKGKGGRPVSPKQKSCGPAGCDYLFGRGKLLTAYDPGGDSVIVTRAWTQDAIGQWKKQ